jgi:hypothetical protein
MFADARLFDGFFAYMKRNPPNVINLYILDLLRWDGFVPKRIHSILSSLSWRS